MAQENPLASNIPNPPTSSTSKTLPASLAWIDSYFHGAQSARRFDGFGRSNEADAPAYFDVRHHPESARTRACVSVEWVGFSEVTQHMPMIYVPCGISSGLRPHELLDMKNRSNRHKEGYETAVSTYKAEEHLGDAHKTKSIEPNRADNLRRGRIVGRLHADSMVVPPVGREGSVRELTRTGAFSRWQKYEEEDFMAFWYPVIDRCTGMVMDGDWNFSRNSIWEMMRGVLIQAGEIPSRPQADMEVMDLEGQPVSLLARAEKVAQTLRYQLGKGFEPREAATALAQIFAIDADLRTGKLPAPGSQVHRVLQYRSPEELVAMDALHAELQPLLLHCAPLMRREDLADIYQEAANKKPRKLNKEQREACEKVAEEVSQQQLSILSVDPSPALRTRLAEVSPAPQRLFDGHERFFEKRAQAKMFEDDLYGKLNEWERLALPFAVGGMETALYPAAQPMATAIFTDLKRGERGFAHATQQGVADMNEVAGASGRDITDVISANAQEAEALKASLRHAKPGQVVVNTLSFLRVADTIEHFRKQEESGRFVAAHGASETSPQARLALQMKYLDRQVGRAVFQPGWQYSNDLVQLRVRARLIQAGLVERPAGVQSGVQVFNADEMNTPQSLLDDMRALTAEVKRACDAQVRAPEQAIALMRLVTLHELLVDPTLQQASGRTSRELINPLLADESLTCYDRAQAKQLAEEAKALLVGQAAQWVPRERLYAERDASDDADRASAKEVQNRRMEDYIKAGETLRSQQGWATRTQRQDDVITTRRGASR